MIPVRPALKLYLVADPEHCRGNLLTSVESALNGGVTMVQLRSRQLSDLESLNLAVQLRLLCRSFDIPFVVNDRVDIALASDADGVHLGVDDMPLDSARNLGGNDFIIGYSPDTDEQLLSARKRGATYLGIGPVFATITKRDAGEALGLETLARRIQLGGLAAVGIGGINAENARSVIEAGVDGIAVVSAILGAGNPEAAARQISRNS